MVGRLAPVRPVDAGYRAARRSPRLPLVRTRQQPIVRRPVADAVADGHDEPGRRDVRNVSPGLSSVVTPHEPLRLSAHERLFVEEADAGEALVEIGPRLPGVV